MNISNFGDSINPTPPTPGSRSAEQIARNEGITQQEGIGNEFSERIGALVERVRAIPERGFADRLKSFLTAEEGKEFDQRHEQLGVMQDQNINARERTVEEIERSNKNRIKKAFIAGAGGALGAFAVNSGYVVALGGFGPFSPAWGGIIGLSAVGAGAVSAYRESQKIKQQELDNQRQQLDYQRMGREKEVNIQAKVTNEQEIQERLRESNESEIRVLDERIKDSTERITTNHTEIQKALNERLSQPETDDYGVVVPKTNTVRLFETIKNLPRTNRDYIESYNDRSVFSIPGMNENRIIIDFQTELFGRGRRNAAQNENMKFILTLLQDYAIPVKMGTADDSAIENLSLKNILAIEDERELKLKLRFYQKSLKKALNDNPMDNMLNHIAQTDPRNLVLPMTGNTESVNGGSSDIDVLARYRYLLRNTEPYRRPEPPIEPVVEE